VAWVEKRPSKRARSGFTYRVCDIDHGREIVLESGFERKKDDSRSLGGSTATRPEASGRISRAGVPRSTPGFRSSWTTASISLRRRGGGIARVCRHGGLACPDRAPSVICLMRRAMESAINATWG
jgi:hypothetical protein